MSMELWQRLKDLEKKVQEQSERLKALQAVSPLEIAVLQAPERAIAGADRGLETQPAPSKHKLCPKCGKAAARYFHVKYCTGNADLA
jgi:DNA-directed RNA polymerase subunit M/transcription elongation factor TFIIS